MKSAFRMTRGARNTKNGRCGCGNGKAGFAAFAAILYRWLIARLSMPKEGAADIEMIVSLTNTGTLSTRYATKNATRKRVQFASSLTFLAGLILLLSSSTTSAWAQAGFSLYGQATSPLGTPAPSARITVCPYTATGIPCSPQASIYSDPSLASQYLLPQPYAADQLGNYQFWVTPGTSYLVQVQDSPFSPPTSYVVTAGGSGSSGGVTSLDGITGAVTLHAGNGISITDNSPSTGQITITATGSGGIGDPGLGIYTNPVGQTDSELTANGTLGTAFDGDSQTCAFGLAGSSCGASVSGGWNDALSNEIGAPNLFFNYALSGSNSADVSESCLMYRPIVGDSGNPMNYNLTGLNNARFLNSSAGQILAFKQQMASCIAWATVSGGGTGAAATNKFLGSDTAYWTQGGTWTNQQSLVRASGLAFNGSNYAVNDTITATCTGGTGPTYLIGAVSNSTAQATISYSITSNIITVTYTGGSIFTSPNYLQLSGYGTSTFLNGVVLNLTASTANTFTAPFPGGHADTGPITEAGRVAFYNTLGSSTLQSPGSGCTNIGAYPSTSYPTTTSGSGIGAVINLYISPVQPIVSNTVGNTLTNTVPLTVPNLGNGQGAIFVWYSQYASGGGAGTITGSVDGLLGDVMNSGSTTISAVNGGLAPVNIYTNAPSSALAIYNVSAGPQTFTIQQTGAGKFGVFSVGIAPSIHNRGTGAPNMYVGGVPPTGMPLSGTNVIAPYSTIYSQASEQVTTLLRQSYGLQAGYADMSNLDQDLDYLSANQETIIACSANGSAATFTSNTPNTYYPGWTGVLSGLTSGNCPQFNGAQTIASIISPTQFTVTSAATAFGTTTDSGTWQPNTGNTYQGRIANVGNSTSLLHPSGGAAGGYARIKGNFEAASRAFGIGATSSLGLGGSLTAGIKLQPGAYGVGINPNGSHVSSTTLFPPGLVLLVNGPDVIEETLQSLSTTNAVGAPNSLALVGAFGTSNSTVRGYAWGNYPFTSLPGTQAAFTYGLLYTQNNLYHLGNGAATSTNNTASFLDVFCAGQAPNSTGCAQINLGVSGNGTTASPEFNFNFSAQTLTGILHWRFLGASGTGYYLEANQAGAAKAILLPPAASVNITPPAQSGTWAVFSSLPSASQLFYSPAGDGVLAPLNLSGCSIASNILTCGGGSSPLTTKGDLYTFGTAGARLPVGTNNYTLVADSTQTLGLKWAPVVLPNALTLNNSGSGTASGATFDGSTALVLSYNTIGAAPTASPAFTGAPTAPTATVGTNTTQIATTAFVLANAGSGSGISGLTAGFLPLAGTATTLTGNSPLDYGITNAGFVTSSKPMVIADTTDPGFIGLVPNGVAPAVVSGAAGWGIGATLTTAGTYLFPTAPGTGVWFGTNASGVVTNTFMQLQGTDSKILTAGTISGTSVLICTDASGGATTSSCPSAGSSVTLQTNSVNNTSQTALNLTNSSTNVTGLAIAITNPATSTDLFEITGTVNVAHGGTGAATAAANTFFGNNTGSTAAPSFSKIGVSDFTPNSYIADTGSVNALVATMVPAATALVVGLEVNVKPAFANTTTTPTINVNGLGAKTITKLGTTALVAGDLTTTAVASLIYDGTEFQLQNPQVVSGGSLPTSANTTSVTSGLLAAQAGSNSIVNGQVFFGDSNPQGYSLQGGGNNQITQECIDTGTPANVCNQQAFQSYNFADGTIKVANTLVTSEFNNPLYTVIYGTNEIDTGTANTPTQRLGMIQEGLFFASYLGTAPSEQTYFSSGATLTGSYASDTSTFTAAKGAKTTTTGTATKQVTVYDNGEMYCWVYQFTSSTGVFTMNDVSNGTAPLTDLTTGNSSFTSLGIARSPAVAGTTWLTALHFNGLTKGVHQIQQTVTTSGPTGISGCTGASGKHGGQGAPGMIYGDIMPLQYGTYASTVATANTDVKTIWATAIASGFNVTPWDIFSDMNTTTHFDSKSVIGATVTSVGSGQTNGTYCEAATTSTQSSVAPPYLQYTIAGGAITGQVVPCNSPAANFTSAYNVTAASWTVAHGGTPGTFTAILSTNANYAQAPPYHLAQDGQNAAAKSWEKAAQVALIASSEGMCAGTGTQTLTGQCHTLNLTATSVITLPTNVSTPSISTQGITQGMAWDIINNGSGNVTFTGSTGGTAGLSSSQFVIPAQDKNNFGSSVPSGCRIKLVDTTGIYNVVSCTPNVVTPFPIQATLTPGTGVTSATCNTAACTIDGGTITVVGGTFTTGVFLTLTWSATPVIRICSIMPQGNISSLGLTHSVATTTGFTWSSSATITGQTFTVDYSCQRP